MTAADDNTTESNPSESIMADSTKSRSPPRTELSAHETLLMWVMPFSQVLSWAALIGTKVADESNSLWLLIVGAFYWLWALKNVTVGPLKTDLGIVTYLTVLIPGAIGTFGTDSTGVKTAATVGAVLLFLHYGGMFKRVLPIVQYHNSCVRMCD